MEIRLDSVLTGRILAGVVILLALVSAIVGAASARSGAFDIFLARLTTPLGVGFLIIVATEILRALDSTTIEGGEEPAGSGE